jgi:predicted DNA-binding transcriptional regulator AlpA
MSDKLLYTPGEFATLTGIPEETLKYWRKQHEGPPYVKLGRHVRYSHKTIMQYIENRTVDPNRGGRRNK